MGATTYGFVSGAIAALYVVAGLFFLRFWRRTRDALFVNFALAFWLFAAQAVMSIAGVLREEQSWLYLLRLLAFALIIVAIVRKNLEGRRPAGGGSSAQRR